MTSFRGCFSGNYQNNAAAKPPNMSQPTRAAIDRHPYESLIQVPLFEGALIRASARWGLIAWVIQLVLRNLWRGVLGGRCRHGGCLRGLVFRQVGVRWSRVGRCLSILGGMRRRDRAPAVPSLLVLLFRGYNVRSW